MRRGDGRGWWEGMVGRGDGKGWWKGTVGRGGGKGWLGTGMAYLLTQGEVEDFLWQ